LCSKDMCTSPISLRHTPRNIRFFNFFLQARLGYCTRHLSTLVLVLVLPLPQSFHTHTNQPSSQPSNQSNQALNQGYKQANQENSTSVQPQRAASQSWLQEDARRDMDRQIPRCSHVGAGIGAVCNTRLIEKPIQSRD
jgi:hypothetical protein